ncbi:hypothetical protein S225a_05200 [Candidatus Brocadiaceae bacterium S225]|nr:hypothetical protein S225a_05200 [Candidatus Brocadiaceae bacterium S225]
MMLNTNPITASISTKINRAKRAAILCTWHSTPSSVISWGKSQAVLFSMNRPNDNHDSNHS